MEITSSLLRTRNSRGHNLMSSRARSGRRGGSQKGRIRLVGRDGLKGIPRWPGSDHSEQQGHARFSEFKERASLTECYRQAKGRAWKVAEGVANSLPPITQ